MTYHSFLFLRGHDDDEQSTDLAPLSVCMVGGGGGVEPSLSHLLNVVAIPLGPS